MGLLPAGLGGSDSLGLLHRHLRDEGPAEGRVEEKPPSILFCAVPPTPTPRPGAVYCTKQHLDAIRQGSLWASKEAEEALSQEGDFRICGSSGRSGGGGGGTQRRPDRLLPDSMLFRVLEEKEQHLRQV